MAPLSAYVSALLASKHPTQLHGNLDARSDDLSPLQANSYLATRDAAKSPQNPNYQPGAGTIDPHHVNNHGFFALFALIGVAFVLGGVWFFCIAKNGGFYFKKGDWDDYKSTVLRRKGPNGTTLSGATKTTRLGGGSVVANGGEAEKGWKRGVQVGRKHKGPRGNKNNDDQDVRAYRHEKPAKVGGLNREADGIFNQDFAYSDNTYSDTISEQSQGVHVPINTPKAKKDSTRTKPMNKAAAPTTPSPKKDAKNRFYNQTPGSNVSSDSQRPLRPNGQSPGEASTPSRSRHHSPTKDHARNSVPGSFYTEPLDFESRYSASNSEAGHTEDSRGTKAYFHPLPGLGAEGRNVPGGFRRGRGRRDSLSDSEGETGTTMS